MDEADAARQAFERAAAHDRKGEEAEAIPHYERALRLGLADDLRPAALLGLGSSLRNVGRAGEAVLVLDDACRSYPDHGALRLFRALALASAGRCGDGLAEAIRVALDQGRTPSVERYRGSLENYAAELEGRP
jgi:hypothetical protein